MSKEFRVGIIGLGSRGHTHVVDILAERDDVVVTALCDVYEDRIEDTKNCLEEKRSWNNIFTTTDYRKVCERDDVDVVFVFSAWENHIPAAIYAMNCGKQVGIEVGGAYSIDDCWELVHTYEKTGIHCMMLENCCYDRNEMMVMRMVREGVFGKIVHCEGGYMHDLRDEIVYGEEKRHYRLRNYKNRNCENYPTHELGPIAKILNINRGNRMVSLTSMASGAFGLNEFAKNNDDANPELRTFNFAQGDIVKTNIKCAGGELITLTLDTTLPRNYSRNFTVRGTKGYYSEVCDGIFMDGGEHFSKDFYGNAEEYRKTWEHPVWHKFEIEGVKGGHGGMDWLIFEAYFEALRNGDSFPIDTYDTAAWMAITPLSEISIQNGGSPVSIPDFTRGMWTDRPESDLCHGFFSLDK
ncbi:MAG: Gfo/Idh/MocA family oxidoreductase [Ruminococcaceae bacterium]|nr:Gfo/Idh/MocA family oxidoreductase [Oscillospiraceae bacterium]